MRVFARALLPLALVAALAACGGQGADGKIQLTVGTWGNSGYKELIKKYEKSHPSIDVVERVTEYNAHHQTLSVQLASGNGANDVEGVEEGFITQFRAQPDKFLNLLDYGAAKLKDHALEWKWKQSMSSDGKVQIGFGTDVGGLAMCYRPSLFKKAGLPADPDEVSKLWPDWESYLEVGRKFAAAKVDAHWFDSASNVYNAMVAQLPLSYYNTDNKIVAKDQTRVRDAFYTTSEAIKDGQSAGLSPFSPQWSGGFQKAGFATVTCPAWMMGYIKNAAPKTAGDWDIATVPGRGGNWGGSFLAVPKQTEHPKEAYELASWLTAPAQQLAVFKATGNFPADPQLHKHEALRNFTSDFFGGAKVGEIFADSAESLQPQYLGPKHGAVRAAFERALQRVEQGKQSPPKAWDVACKDALQAAGQ